MRSIPSVRKIEKENFEGKIKSCAPVTQCSLRAASVANEGETSDPRRHRPTIVRIPPTPFLQITLLIPLRSLRSNLTDDIPHVLVGFVLPTITRLFGSSLLSWFPASLVHCRLSVQTKRCNNYSEARTEVS